MVPTTHMKESQIPKVGAMEAHSVPSWRERKKEHMCRREWGTRHQMGLLYDEGEYMLILYRKNSMKPWWSWTRVSRYIFQMCIWRYVNVCWHRLGSEYSEYERGIGRPDVQELSVQRTVSSWRWVIYFLYHRLLWCSSMILVCWYCV